MGLSALRVSVLRAAVGPGTLAESACVVFRSCSVQSLVPAAGLAPWRWPPGLPSLCVIPRLVCWAGSGGGGRWWRRFTPVVVCLVPLAHRGA